MISKIQRILVKSRGSLKTIIPKTAAPIVPVIHEPEFLAQAAAALPDGVLDQETWPRWTRQLGEQTGRKGKALFQPLRLAHTGREHGPEMKNLLPLIGAARRGASCRRR